MGKGQISARSCAHGRRYRRKWRAVTRLQLVDSGACEGKLGLRLSHVGKRWARRFGARVPQGQGGASAGPGPAG